jgi:hypothetical protein
MKTFVITDFDIIGFHHYPTPPKEVEFLKHNHRHIFRIRAGFRVVDLDREIEIFIQEEKMKAYLCLKYGVPCQFGAMSCEMIAMDLYHQFKPNWVEVFEDDRGGARLEL